MYFLEGGPDLPWEGAILTVKIRASSVYASIQRIHANIADGNDGVNYTDDVTHDVTELTA